MSQPDSPTNPVRPVPKNDKPLHPQDAPGEVPDIAGEYGIIGVDKDFWKDPFIEVEKDPKTGKLWRVI